MKLFLSKIKYKHIFLFLISIFLIISLVIFLINTWINLKLDKDNISLENISESIHDSISNSFKGSEVKIDDIELTKKEDGKIYLLLKNVSIYDELGRVTINSPIVLIENGLMSYFFGSFSKRYLEKITERSIQLKRPTLSFFEDKNGRLGFDANQNEDLNANYHFYQSYLTEIYNLASTKIDSPYNKYLKSIKKLDIKDASIVVYDQKNKENLRIDNVALNFNKNESAVSINLKITPESMSDDWYIDVNVLNNFEKNYTNLDLKFKNISNQIHEVNYLNFLGTIQTPLSGAVNFDITELGRIHFLKSDINIGEGKIYAGGQETKDHKFNINDQFIIKDGYLSFVYESSSNELKINEMKLDNGNFIIDTSGKIVLDFNHIGLLKSSKFLFNRLQVSNDKNEKENLNFLTNGNLKGEINFEPFIVKIESLETIFEDGIVSLNGDYHHDRKEKLKLFLNIKDTNISNIYTLWPKEYNKKIRNWFLDNVKDSFILSSELKLHSDDMQDYNMELDLNFIDTDISYYRDLPNLSNALGSLSIKESKLNLLIRSADIMVGEGRILNVKNSTLDISDLSNQILGEFDLNINGEIEDSINYLSKLDFNLDKFDSILDGNITGKSKINSQFQIPFFSTGSDKDTNINAKINIKDLMVKFPNDHSLSSADFNIIIDNNNLHVSNDIYVNGIEAKIDINSNLDQDEGQTNLIIDTKLSPTDLKIFGINTASYHSGFAQAPVKLEIMIKGNTFEEFRLTSELSKLELRFPGTNWVKYPGDKASLEVVYNKEIFSDDIINARVKFFTEKESLDAVLRFDKKYEIQEINILNFNNKDTDGIQVIGLFDSERNLSLDIVGKSFDVSSLIDKNVFSNASDKSNITIPIVNLNILNIEKIIGKDNTIIDNLSGNIILQYGKLYQADLNGYLNGDNNLKIKYSDQNENLPADLGINTNNAGEFFKFIGIYSNVLSGNMQLRAQGPKINNLSGKLFINDFDISEDSTLSALFATSGPSPELSYMDNVSFKKLDIDFTLINGSINVDKSLIVGPSVGLSFSGQFNQDTGYISIYGNYIPAYELNSSFGLIPIFGPLLSGGEGEGMFAVPFVIIREKYGESTLIKADAAGLLAPGILRKFFDY